jgi:hypothetical protein
MALLTNHAYERAGVAASIAVHFGVNTTIALLTVDAPVTQAFVLGVQLVVAVTLVAGSGCPEPRQYGRSPAMATRSATRTCG